jgi:hypothetical protein
MPPSSTTVTLSIQGLVPSSTKARHETPVLLQLALRATTYEVGSQRARANQRGAGSPTLEDVPMGPPLPCLHQPLQLKVHPRPMSVNHLAAPLG